MDPKHCLLGYSPEQDKVGYLTRLHSWTGQGWLSYYVIVLNRTRLIILLAVLRIRIRIRIRIRWIRIILALWIRIRIRKKMRIHGSGSKQSFIFLNMQNSLIFPWKYQILNFFKDLKNILRVSGFYLPQILTPDLHRAPPPPLITREGGRSLPSPHWK